jgi:hypothetical protein
MTSRWTRRVLTHTTCQAISGREAARARKDRLCEARERRECAEGGGGVGAASGRSGAAPRGAAWAGRNPVWIER